MSYGAFNILFPLFNKTRVFIFLDIVYKFPNVHYGLCVPYMVQFMVTQYRYDEWAPCVMTLTR